MASTHPACYATGMKFSELIEEYERGPWAALAYPDRASSRARRALEFLGDIQVAPQCDAWSPEVTKRAQSNWGIKNSSMNRYIAVLDSMGFNVSYLPVDKDPKVRVLTNEQLKQLDANVRGDHDLHCQAIYAIMRDTGCRGLAEFHRLEARDIDFVNSTVELRSLKGRKGLDGFRVRTVPLTEVAHRAFAWLHDEDHFVTDSRWRAFWQRVRLDDTNVPYDLRHTFCTRLLDCDVPLSTVMRIMGHTNVAQTLYYQHQRPSALEAARTALQTE